MVVNIDINKEGNSSNLNQVEDMKGHPLPCSSGCCSSRLRILQAGAVHYPALRPLLNNTRWSENDIREIESSPSKGSICSLKNKLNLQDLLDDELLDNDDSSTTESNLCPPLSYV